jgi:hypothetical protein
MSPLLGQTLAPYPDLFERMDHIINRERTFALFKQLADTYAPSLTVRYTRAPLVAQWLKEAGQQGLAGSNLTVAPNYLSTGNVALSFGSAPGKPVWAMAHLDIISFLTGERSQGRYALTPFCEARQTEGVRPALALAFSAETGGLEPVASGQLHSTDKGHFFETEVADLPPASRVVYASQATWDQASGMIYGTVDDAAGGTALILAATVLSHYPVEALIVLTDEEEGVVGVGNRAFSRGSTRLLNRIAPDHLPDLITISDLHEEVKALAQGNLDQARFGQGSLFAGFASGTRGGVTPPQLLAFQRELAHYLAQHGIKLQENSGYVSRSDCVSAMLATPNVALIGYPGAYSHFIDTPRCHVDDLVDLAKVIVTYILVAQDRSWRSQLLGAVR